MFIQLHRTSFSGYLVQMGFLFNSCIQEHCRVDLCLIKDVCSKKDKEAFKCFLLLLSLHSPDFMLSRLANVLQELSGEEGADGNKQVISIHTI